VLAPLFVGGLPMLLWIMLTAIFVTVTTSLLITKRA
jgi:hypothetical protein